MGNSLVYDLVCVILEFNERFGNFLFIIVSEIDPEPGREIVLKFNFLGNIPEVVAAKNERIGRESQSSRCYGTNKRSISCFFHISLILRGIRSDSKK